MCNISLWLICLQLWVIATSYISFDFEFNWTIWNNQNDNKCLHLLANLPCWISIDPYMSLTSQCRSISGIARIANLNHVLSSHFDIIYSGYYMLTYIHSNVCLHRECIFISNKQMAHCSFIYIRTNMNFMQMGFIAKLDLCSVFHTQRQIQTDKYNNWQTIIL